MQNINLMGKWDKYFFFKSPVPPCFVPYFLFPVYALPGTCSLCDGQLGMNYLEPPEPPELLSRLSSCMHQYMFSLLLQCRRCSSSCSVKSFFCLCSGFISAISSPCSIGHLAVILALFFLFLFFLVNSYWSDKV